MPNDMTFYQAATLLNAVQQQATGQASIAPANFNEFVSAAQTTLRTGYDPVMNAISQVFSRTIFSIRPYDRRFALAEISESAYGNHVRKLSIADTPIEDDERYKWPAGYDASHNANPLGDGESVDMQRIKKNQILQTNFYGANVWQDHYTIWRDQLDCAFSSPEEFARFVTMITGNMADKLEQVRETMGRACVINSIIGTFGATARNYEMGAFNFTTRSIPLLTLYNEYTGESFTQADIFKPANWAAFTRWAFSIIQSVSKLMEQRSEAFQTVVDGKHVMRHTPKDRQKMFVHTQAMSMFDTMASAVTYNDGYLTLPNGVRVEEVAYWQSIRNPMNISGSGSRIGENGAPVTVEMGSGDIPSDLLVLAYLFDEEALGYATLQQWAAPAPFNAAGGYTNTWLHETQRLYNDHTEKSVVFVLA